MAGRMKPLIVSAADYDGQLPEGWERFVSVKKGIVESGPSLGRFRWYRVQRKRSERRWDTTESTECWWVPWDYVITIDSQPVGLMGAYLYPDQDLSDPRFENACYQINWPLRIPPTRFNDQEDALTFALLFTERHGDRLLRAIQSPKSATHMLQDRIHTKPYELGASLFYSWGDDDGRFAWILDKRGERLELLFGSTAEPVVARKGTEHSSMLWGDVEKCDDTEVHETAAYKANQRRSEHAKARQRKSDGCFARVGSATTTQPEPSRADGTGSDVGVQ